MATTNTLLDAARGGDHDAYRALIEPHTAELRAHCYRMLGSIHDAEDALQDTLLGAWRGLPRFEGRSSLRSWLYRIATNACLKLIERRPKRVLPVDYGPASDPHDDLAEPLVESAWVEPFPDDQLQGDLAAPDARYEERESVELAFTAALQHLPPRQRAALILRDVLGLSGGDVDALAAMLTDDATIAMPPRPSWYRGRDAVAAFLRAWPLAGALEARLVPVRANGQLAFANYTRRGGA